MGALVLRSERWIRDPEMQDSTPGHYGPPRQAKYLIHLGVDKLVQASAGGLRCLLPQM